MNIAITVFSIILVIPSLALIFFICVRFFCIYCVPVIQRRCCYNNVIEADDDYNSLIESSIL